MNAHQTNPNSRRRIATWSISLIAIFLTSCISLADTVTVNLSVHTEAGAPLPSVPMEVHSPTDIKFVMTGVDGTVSVSLQVSPGDDFITCWLHNTSRGWPLDSATKLLAVTKHEEYWKTYFFEEQTAVPIVAGATSYDLNIIAYDTIKVTGRVTNHIASSSDSILLYVRDGTWLGKLKNQLPFEARGVRKGAPAELFFATSHYAVESIRLTAEQTQNDIALGDITFPENTGDAAVQITMLNAPDLYGPGVQKLDRTITLISIDGSVILGFPTMPDGTAVKNPRTTGPPESPTIPPGTYYVAPGNFGHPLQLMLLDAIRAGKIAELDGHQVPKITAPGALTFDALEARNRIIDVAEGVPVPP